jgi:hypothetical protein
MQAECTFVRFTPKENIMTQLIGGEKFSADVSVGREHGIGGSDARFIMNGEWRKLYREKLGLDPLPDFDNMFMVQLGKYTEPFHLRWLDRIGTIIFDEPQDFYVHPQHGFLFAHLDGWDLKQDTFVEAKHCHGAADFRTQAQFYLPQIAHECLVTGKAEGWFSMIAGNADPRCELVRPTSDYIEQYFELAKQFWWHLSERIEPEDILSTAATTAMTFAADEVDKTLIGGLRNYDMGHSNEWCDHAATLIECKDAYAKYGKADKAIRTLVPKDGAVVRGFGVCFKRDTAGKLRISFE